jgi:heptosyltransferase-3
MSVLKPLRSRLAKSSSARYLGTMDSVLFITSTRIGDAIINSGVLNHLVETRPNARFTIACGPLAAPLFAGTPRLDRTIIMRKQKRGGHWFDLWKQTVSTKWSLVVDLRCSATSWVLRADERRILRQSPTPINKVIEAASVLDLDPVPLPGLFLTDAVKAEAARLIPDGSPVLGVCPSASWPFKMWPGTRFGTLMQRLIVKDGPMPGARVAIFGGPDDHEAARPIHDALPDAEIIDLTGLGLAETAACLERVRLYVGNDSGLMHMSAAVKTPTLGLFGPSDHRCYGPYGDHCDLIRGDASFEQIDAEHDDRRLHPTSLLLDLSVDATYEAACRLYERTS